jgi:hypothetical protein
MPTELTVTNEDPINLAACLDAAGDLQLAHDSDSLGDYGQTLVAEHDDYNTSGETVRIKLFDFQTGDSWELSASHDSGTSTWSRGSDHSYFDFGLVTGLVEVDVVATSDASPPATKTRKIWVKTKPTNPLPDRP